MDPASLEEDASRSHLRSFAEVTSEMYQVESVES